MKLRVYQEKQLNFLKSKDLFHNTVGIESPTGSGKSFVILSYIKHQFENSRNSIAVITTGSNNLVFEFYREAKKMGIDTYIYVGNTMMTCYDKLDNGQYFTLNKDLLCSTTKKANMIEVDGKNELCDKCKKCKLPHIKELKNIINNFGNKLIITNHLAYLTHVFKENIYTPDLVIVDEAHMFNQFYETFNSVSISSTDMNNIRQAIKNTPQEKLFDIFINKGEPLPEQLTLRICGQIKQYFRKYKNMFIYSRDLCKRLTNFTQADKNDEDIIYKINNSEMTKLNLFYHFNIKQDRIKYILFSATLDKYTRLMFGLEDEDFYIERNFNLVDYSKSTAYIYKINDFKDGINRFIKICENNNYDCGLILSTRIDNVAYAKSLKYIGKYKVCTSLKEFRDTENPKVLVGSKAYFQGIDLPEIQFVAINKIPFEQYDEEFRKKADFLKKYAKIDTWNDYTLPLCKNNMIQTTGRLWRTPSDFGSIAIFDSRLDGRFKYLQKTLTMRNGINIEIVGNDIELENEEGFDDIITEVKEDE